MSLYGGIKFTIGDTEHLGSSSTQKYEAQAQARAVVEGDAPKPLPADTTNAQGKAPVKSLQTAVKASAALKFAPRIRQSRPPTGSNTTYSAEPVFIDTLHPEPTTASSSSSIKEKSHEVVFGTDGKALAKAPAMTLNAGGGKRERGKEEEQRRKQKKKQRRRQQQQQLMSDFKPDEQYDPNRPNDLGEYQYYRKKLREEKRARLLEEKKRKEKDGSSGESSYYSDSEDEAPRRDAPKMWAPPTSIYGTASAAPPRSQPPPPPPPIARPRSPQPPPASGDEAYARRLAMSQASTGDDAYARRQAMSARPPPTVFARHADPPPPVVSSTSTSIAAARGDDAYARRVGLSQGQSQAAPPPPNFAPPGITMPSDPPAQSLAPTQTMPPFPPATSKAPSQSMPPFPPTQAQATPQAMPPFPPSNIAVSSGSSISPHTPVDNFSIPGFGPRPGPVLPAEPTQSAEPAAGTPSSDDFARMLAERKQAAASIAERLKNLVPPAAPPPIVPEPDDGTGSFAEKMMRRWGHKEGTGLGADGSGIKHALTAEHVVKPTDPKQPLSKRQLAKQKAAAANAKNKKWVMHATNRGKIVNANEEERRNEEQGKYGEASRIICLVGLVGGEDEIDEGLSEEIGEECSKFGIVERVVQHLVEPAPVDPAECLRVFVVFSGMAGAWRSVKELDGRFFGGRKLRATYFDETRFNAGDRDGSTI